VANPENGMKKAKVKIADIPVVMVPADKMDPNPRNPYSHLTPAERHARSIRILSEIYKRMKGAEKKIDTSGGSPI